MGTEFQEVLCDEHAIGGDGEYCGDNDAQFGRINVLYFEASGGKHIPRAVFFDLERRDRRCACVAARRALPSGIPREP
jgi:tubulin beta